MNSTGPFGTRFRNGGNVSSVAQNKKKLNTQEHSINKMNNEHAFEPSQRRDACSLGAKQHIDVVDLVALEHQIYVVVNLLCQLVFCSSQKQAR